MEGLVEALRRPAGDGEGALAGTAVQAAWSTLVAWAAPACHAAQRPGAGVDAALADTCARETELVVAAATLAVYLGVYYTVGHCFLALDMRHRRLRRAGRPEEAARFGPLRKMQPERAVTDGELRDLYLNLLVGFWACLVPGAVLLAKARMLRLDARLPPVAEVLAHLACAAAGEEVMFYWSHRLLHRVAYSSVHAVHHRFTAPVALAATYAHPAEVIAANLAPIGLTVSLLRAHVFTVLVWFVLAVVVTQFHHCGWTVDARVPLVTAMPHAKQPDFHDRHHFPGFNSNFGLLGVLDWLHGTTRVEGKRASAAAAAPAASAARNGQARAGSKSRGASPRRRR